MPGLLGIDSGLTVTKAVVFDADGTVSSRSLTRRRCRRRSPSRAGSSATWTGSGGRPPRPSPRRSRGQRAAGRRHRRRRRHRAWRRDIPARRRGQPAGSGDPLARQPGRRRCRGLERRSAEAALGSPARPPHASALGTAPRLDQAEQPERYRRIGHMPSPARDWLRFCLTGTIGTDRTEASTAFTAVRSRDLCARGPAPLRARGPRARPAPIAGSAEIGEVTPRPPP